MADSKPPVMDFQQKVAGYFGDALDWMRDTFSDPVLTAAIAGDLRISGAATTPPPIDDDRMASIRAYTESADPDAQSFAQVVEDIITVSAALGGWIDAIKDGDDDSGELLYLLLTMGTVERMRIRAPFLWGVAQTGVGFHDAFSAAPGVTEGSVLGLLSPLLTLLRQVGSALHFPLVTDPGAGLTEDYATGLSNLIAVALTGAAQNTGLGGYLDAYSGWDHPIPGSTTPTTDAISQRALTLVAGDMEDPDGPRLVITFLLVPEGHGGPGIILSIGGELTFTQVVPQPRRLEQGDTEDTPGEIPALEYRLETLGTGGISVFMPLGEGTDGWVFDSAPQGAIDLAVKPVMADSATLLDDEPVVRPAPRGQPAFRIGDPAGTRMEIATFEGGFDIGPDRARARLIFRDIEMIAVIGEADSFLASQPADDIRFKFDLAMTADTENGFSFEGGGGLRIVIPVSRTVFRVFVIHHVEFFLGDSPTDRDTALTVTGAFAIRLGPFTATVEGLGFLLDVAFESGNLGIADVDIGFEPPRGIGLVLDAVAIKGGGFLFFDRDKAEYAGVLELKWGPVTFKALGILTTRLPGGATGWSLLLLVFGEFPAMQIGFGFTLIGLGGLMGIQHAVAVNALQSGMRSGVLDSVLFPEDPVANAPRVLNQLRTVFPITPRALTLGPFAQFGYSTPAIAKIQLGLIFQVDNVFRSGDRDAELTRLVLVGQLLVEMPPSETRTSNTPVLLKLLVDILGDFDFQAQSLAIDARLRDSKLAGMTLTGSLAVRARFGDRPGGLIAAGGFHPKFKDIPEGFPKQDRLGLQLKKGIATVKIESYWALTTNTVQFGARAFAQAKKWGFTVEGWLGWDVLVEVRPVFRFVADVEAGVSLKKGSRTLMGIDLKLTVEGPGRWRLAGSAKFKIFFVSKTIRFDEEWGDAPALPVVTVDTETELVAAFSDSGNWSAQLPEGGEMLVSLRSTSFDGRVAAHPLGRLSGVQRVVPLELDIDRVGEARPAKASKFAVTAVTLDGDPTDRSYVEEHFARAMYVDMSDEEKLETESFERLPAGVSIGSQGLSAPKSTVTGNLDYETIYLGSHADQGDNTRSTFPIDILMRQARVGAAGRSPLRPHRFLADGAVEAVSVTAPVYAAVSVADMGAVNTNTEGGSFSQVSQAVRRAGKTGDVQIVEAHEAEEVAVS
jgi:hypothetical protein